MTFAPRELLPPVIASAGVSPLSEPVDPGRDADFARIALPLLPTLARVAGSLARDRADADDLVQETFLKAFRHWHTFVPGSDCKRWLAAICRNTFFAQRARQRWVTAVGDDMELETFAAVHLHKLARDRGVEDVFARVDVGPAIREAIDALDAPFREVVLLVDVEEFRYEEAADVLGIPVGTVRSRLYRARRQLQQLLVDYAVDAGFSSVRRSSPALTAANTSGVPHAKP